MTQDVSQFALAANDSLFFADLCKSFERHLKAQQASPHTLSHYLSSTRIFVKFCEEQGLPFVTKARREHIELWLVALIEHGYASATVLNRFKGLHAFYRWLLEEGEITENPMSRMAQPKVEETRKDLVPEPDMIKVLKLLEKNRRWRNCVLIAVTYDTGIRAGEFAAAEVTDADLDAGTLTLPKTKNRKMRTLPLSPQAVRYIDRYLRQRKEKSRWLVTGRQGRQMTPNGIYQAIRGVFEEMGYPALVGPHDLRHTSASAMAGELSETELMTIFGWTDPEMARHYTRQVQEKNAIAAHRKASPLERLNRK